MIAHPRIAALGMLLMALSLGALWLSTGLPRVTRSGSVDGIPFAVPTTVLEWIATCVFLIGWMALSSATLGHRSLVEGVAIGAVLYGAAGVLRVLWITLRAGSDLQSLADARVLSTVVTWPFQVVINVLP